MSYNYRLNYLHYGNSLEILNKIEVPIQYEYMKKSDFISCILGGNFTNKFVLGIIESYVSRKKKKINTATFKADIYNSLEKRKIFNAMGFRGFSYNFLLDKKLFIGKLKSKINLRFSLMADSELFYPFQIKKYLSSFKNSHHQINGNPCIAFALGNEIDNNWYILVLQSDLSFDTPSYIKEHFRGWNKLLLYNIINIAPKSIRSIYLIKSQEVLKACHPKIATPKKVPPSWISIYDELSTLYNMNAVEIKAPIDIQIFKQQKPVYSKDFYLFQKEKYNNPVYLTPSSGR